MDTKTSLLDQLRIQRGGPEEPAPGGIRPWHLAVAGAVVLAAGAGTTAWMLSRPAAAPAAAAADSPAASAGAAEAAAAAEAGDVPVAGSLLDASGYIVAQRTATVSAKQMGRVLDVLIETGQVVQAGQVVARLDDSNMRAALTLARAQLDQATAALEAARVSLADARPIFERNQEQLRAQVISAQDFDTAKSAYDTAQTTFATQQAAVSAARASLAVAERNEDDMTVRAPFPGVVTDKAAQPGEIVSPMATSGYTRTGICTIVDMGSLAAEVDVSESFINRVHPGQPAVVHLNAYPDWAIPGTVAAIIPTADRSKATVKVRVRFEVLDPRILPEMGTRVSFLAENKRG